MKITFSIGIRRYGAALTIAELLGDLRLSAAAGDVDEAVEKLRVACRGALGRTHPRLLAQMGRAPGPHVDKLTLPVLRRRTDRAWSKEEDSAYLERSFYVLERRYKGVLEMGALGQGSPVWVACTPETRAASRDAARALLLHTLRRNERTLPMHRALPDEFFTAELEVDFEPLDLARMPVDSLWLDAFGEVEADDEELDEAPTLRAVARDWTLPNPAARIERGILPAFERDDLIEQLTELLGASRPAAVVLVGPDRVGKTSIIKHLAWLSATEPARFMPGNDPGTLDTPRRMWFADPPRLTSTDPMSDGWQAQCARLVSELEAHDDLLYIGRLVQALDAGKFVGSDYNLAQFLKPHLSDRRLRLIAEASPEEWSRIEQRDVGFARAFHVLRVSDPPEDQARRIITSAAWRMSETDNIRVDAAAVERAWRLEKRFATKGSPVGRAIDFLRRTVRRAGQTFQHAVSEVDLVERFCEESGLPPVMLLDERSLDLARVRERLGRRVMGQEEAVARIAHVVGITKAGLAPADRPLGSFFFVGPTGVGKTELARALAEFLFGHEDRMVRLDMSEYGHPDAYTRLIGEGAHEGDLTGPVRRQPFSVVLLDEVEKAHHSVYDLLLQVLGEARLSDADGRTTRFQNTIVIMTSNLGVDTLRPAIGFGLSGGVDSAEEHFKKAAERYFRPEFLARIDQFIPFQSLSRPVIEAIARRELTKLVGRDGLNARDIETRFDEQVVSWVAAAGWDVQYGARPIKRVVEQRVAWPMARHLAEAGGLDPDLSYRLSIGLDGDTTTGRLTFSLQSQDAGADSRRALLAQIERIAELRRRLERCMYAELYAELAWRVQDFDNSSQTEGFWELSDAAETARTAENARDLVTSVFELSGELEAIEDLVREAYHTRSFELSADIDQRVDEIDPRLHEVFVELLRSAHDEPDQVVLFLPATDPEDPWRTQLIRWYRQLADMQGWRMSMRRAVPRAERPDAGDIDEADRRDLLWQPARKPSGTVLALEFKGPGTRPLLGLEDGLHRRISEDGNATTEVFLLPEGVAWPRPGDLESERPTRPDARIFNFRTMEVSMRGVSGLELQEKNPWRILWPRIEDLAWELAGTDWW